MQDWISITSFIIMANLLAVFSIKFASLNGLVATITAIIGTAIIVVVVIADTVTLVLRRSTGLLGRLAKVLGVDTKHNPLKYEYIRVEQGV